MPNGTFFNGPVLFKTGQDIDPTCFHGIRQATLKDCECSCEVEDLHETMQDTGYKHVTLHDGQFILHTVDLEIPGRGFPCKFERTYRSGVLFDGPLGHNWEFNYNRRLFVEADDSVLRMDGYGRADRYEAVGGSFKAPRGYYTRLISNADGSFTEVDRHRTQAVYAPPDGQGMARMTELRDRNGNRMRFEYNDQGQLVRVLDTLGRPITYRYQDGRLVVVEDFTGRTLRFDYDEQGDFVAITSPSITGTPNGNDFPKGKTTRYLYSAGFSSNQLNHNLLQVIAPNEVAVGKETACIQVVYETNTASANVGRVLQLTMGGINASGIPAGGTISYAYRSLGTANPGDFKTPVSQTTVTDRNENLTEYQFNQQGKIVRIRKLANRAIRPGDPPFFETQCEYNQDEELTLLRRPEGNVLEFVYDDQNPDRLQQGNMLAEIRRPDAKRGGDQAFLKTSYTYEPIYNQRRSTTEARGNDPSYVPQNGGVQSSERYTTVSVFDYQEDDDVSALAQQIGLREAEVQALLDRANVVIGLGDVNADGQTDQRAGNMVQVIHPTVQLLPDSHMAQIERSTQQPIVEISVFNRAGQLTRLRDAEGNVTLHDYYPENDPDGDGKDLTPGMSSEPLGYLKETLLDAESDPIRNSRTNPPPAQIRSRYFYDRVGNVIRQIDGRGVASDYAINQLNQPVQITLAANISQALHNPHEPRWSSCSDTTLPEHTHGMVAFAYRTRIFYDHNNNVIRREVENRDSNNHELAGDFIPSEFSYDILDQLIEETHMVSVNPQESVTMKYRYDRNGNPVLVLSPVANLPAGHPDYQPSNITSSIFDERDLLFSMTRGELPVQFPGLQAHADILEQGDLPKSSDTSTLKRRYDRNRNLVEAIDGADTTGHGEGESTLFLYDGFDRQVSSIDAVGNQQLTQYDPAGNAVRVFKFGSVGGPSPEDNRNATFQLPLHLGDCKQPLLSQVESKYDELGRKFEEDARLFIYEGVHNERRPVLSDGPLGQSNDGMVTTRYEYDRKSRPTFLIEDDLSTSRKFYDGMDRVVRAVDSEGNEVLSTFDDNHNLVTITEVEITQRESVQAGRVPSLREIFTTISVFDSLNRRIRTTDNLGQTVRFHYDSRNNLILTSDAQHSRHAADLIKDPLGLFPTPGQHSHGISKINRPGNIVEYFYDGLNRKIAEVHQLRVDGLGKNRIDQSNPANSDGLIVIDYQWDANSRLVAMADDGSTPGNQNTSIGIIESSQPKGNVTRYRYDDLNRRTREIFADGSVTDYVYDATDNLVRVIDANGSSIHLTYDRINRLVRKDITRATSQDPHPTGGFKDPHVIWQVVGTTQQKFEYNGLSHMTRSFDNNEPENPQDDATVISTYDSLGRPLEEVQNGQAISSSWMGTDNRIRLIYANGREIHFTYDKLRRIKAVQDPAFASPLATYDYIGQERVLQRNYMNGVQLTYLDRERGNDVGYDGLKRPVLLRHTHLVAGFAYGYDRANNKRSEIKQHEKNQHVAYSYDSVYRLVKLTNRQSIGCKRPWRILTPNWVRQKMEDTWQLDGVGNWTNRQGRPNEVNTLNEYTAFAGTRQLYDANGNLIDDGTNLYQYDVFNRLRKVERRADKAVTASYSYDAFHRRTGRIVTNTSSFDDQVSYLYDGWREIEEQRKGSTQQYVYGMWIDEPLMMGRDINNDGKIDSSFFFHEDVKHSITALTNEQGAVVERYTYDAYGKPTVTDDQGMIHQHSSVGNSYLFTGRRYDPETDLYYFRARFLKPHTGRFISRDPIGIWGNSMNMGNGYTYVHNNPINAFDPSGKKIMICTGSAESMICSGCVGTNSHPEFDLSGSVTCVCDIGYIRDVDGSCTTGWAGVPPGGSGSGSGSGSCDNSCYATFSAYEKTCRGLMYLNECLACVDVGYTTCFYCEPQYQGCRTYCDVIREVGIRHCINKPKDPLGGTECNNLCIEQCLGSCQSVSDPLRCNQGCFDQCCKPYAISFPSGAIGFTSPLNFVRLAIPRAQRVG